MKPNPPTRSQMKRAMSVTLLLATMGWACGEAPDPPTQEAPPVPPGVSGRAPTTAQGLPSVVTLHPSPGRPADMPPEETIMDQLGLAFMPTQLLVRVGQPVVFTNSESLAHNVHVAFIDTDSTIFLADMDPNERTQIVLDAEGGYDVTCDVHPGMRAFIYVTTAPHATFADPDGGFSIPDVPPGSYIASVWSASMDLRGQRTVQVSGPSTVLDLSILQ